MLVAVYGSLREGEYNYNYFKNNYQKVDVIEKIEVEGYDLYSLGAYPAIIKGNNKLKVDILDVDPECFSDIKSMEIGAGYSVDTIKFKGSDVPIYIFKDKEQIEFLQNRPSQLVQHGDWVNRSN